jgi:hypothetical protein
MVVVALEHQVLVQMQEHPQTVEMVEMVVQQVVLLVE